MCIFIYRYMYNILYFAHLLTHFTYMYHNIVMYIYYIYIYIYSIYTHISAHITLLPTHYWRQYTLDALYSYIDIHMPWFGSKGFMEFGIHRRSKTNWKMDSETDKSDISVLHLELGMRFESKDAMMINLINAKVFFCVRSAKSLAGVIPGQANPVPPSQLPWWRARPCTHLMENPPNFFDGYLSLVTESPCGNVESHWTGCVKWCQIPMIEGNLKSVETLLAFRGFTIQYECLMVSV